MDVGQHVFSVSYSCFCILKVKCAFCFILSVNLCLLHVKIPVFQVDVSLKSLYLNVHDGPGFC